MKRFVAKVILACMPVIIYVIIFVAYEPYNYWGIKPAKSGSWATPLARVREFMRNPSENIILGDSRMNHFDLEAIEEKTGVRYANLSTGGQGLNLSQQLYEWAKTKTEISNIVIDASFYQLRSGTLSPSAEPVFTIAESPTKYIVTRDYVLEAFDLFIKDMAETIGNSTEDEATISDLESYEDGKYRSDLVYYATQNILTGCQNYSIGKEQMDYLIYILDDVNENGGIPVVVFPPVQESIWDYVIYPLELEDELAEYKEELMLYATLYDGEWLSNFALDQNIYADGFHFLRGDGYQQFEDAIFLGNEDILRIIEKIE